MRLATAERARASTRGGETQPWLSRRSNGWTSMLPLRRRTSRRDSSAMARPAAAAAGIEAMGTVKKARRACCSSPRRERRMTLFLLLSAEVRVDRRKIDVLSFSLAPPTLAETQTDLPPVYTQEGAKRTCPECRERRGDINDIKCIWRRTSGKRSVVERQFLFLLGRTRLRLRSVATPIEANTHTTEKQKFSLYIA